MVATTCVHQEQIEKAGNGIEHGICGICHQVRRYNTIDRREEPRVIKLGRINGAVVLPGPKDIPDLPAQEADELAAGIKEGKLVHVAEKVGATEEHKSQGKVTMGEDLGNKLHEEPKTKPTKSIKRSAKKCKECKFHLIHDEQIWCTSKRCQSRYPADVRPPYRPPIIERPQSRGKKGRSPSDSKVPGGNHASLPTPERVQEALKKAKVANMPPFPGWAPEKWAGEIGVQWLRTYEALLRLQLIHALVLNQPATPEIKQTPRVPAKKLGWFKWFKWLKGRLWDY